MTNPDQQRFLASRALAASRAQPNLRTLRRILLKLGGAEVSVRNPGSTDPLHGLLVDFGIVFSGAVLLKPVHSGISDIGIARAWRNKRYGITAIGMGYGLNDDDFWHEHTFGILREGILETTRTRRKYFGIFLVGEAADGFADVMLGRNGTGLPVSLSNSSSNGVPPKNYH
jgi:hypothetical protein